MIRSLQRTAKPTRLEVRLLRSVSLEWLPKCPLEGGGDDTLVGRTAKPAQLNARPLLQRNFVDGCPSGGTEGVA